jgi:hypothetical protein
MSREPSVERRRHTRHRVLKAARILFNKTSVISCRVRNLSDGGARLDLPSVLGVPPDFTLDIAGDRRADARVVWKTGSEIGVAFNA